MRLLPFVFAPLLLITGCAGSSGYDGPSLRGTWEAKHEKLGVMRLSIAESGADVDCVLVDVADKRHRIQGELTKDEKAQGRLEVELRTSAEEEDPDEPNVAGEGLTILFEDPEGTVGAIKGTAAFSGGGVVLRLTRLRDQELLWLEVWRESRPNATRKTCHLVKTAEQPRDRP
jgi:hypothetical protein